MILKDFQSAAVLKSGHLSVACARKYGFHPEKDGVMTAMVLLENRKDNWGNVWSPSRRLHMRIPISQNFFAVLNLSLSKCHFLLYFRFLAPG